MSRIGFKDRWKPRYRWIMETTVRRAEKSQKISLTRVTMGDTRMTRMEREDRVKALCGAVLGKKTSELVFFPWPSTLVTMLCIETPHLVRGLSAIR